MQLSTAISLSEGDLVTFTGAGGKTTALRVLAAELAAQGHRVLVTTTTRFARAQLQAFPAHLLAPSPQALRRALDEKRVVAVASAIDATHDKALGLTPAAISELRELADIVLVEGDGSKQRPLKAPAAHEPVIPPLSSHVITCAGLWALGRPLTAHTTHRPEIAAGLMDLAPGRTITPAALARLLQHPQGPARGAPAQARRYLLLNGWDQQPQEQRPLLQQMARRLAGHPAFDGVLLAHVQQAEPVAALYSKISAVVLAAGAGTRFGGPKQLALWQGRPLLLHVIEQALASSCNEIIVVLGAHFDRIAPYLQGLPLTIVYQPHWQQGQSASMQAGLAACQPRTGAVCFFLGDQPRLPSDLVNQMISTHQQSAASIIVPRHRGRRGNPVLFDRRLFPALHNIRGDQGGRALFAAAGDDIVWLESGPEILQDVDEPQDLVES